MKCPSCGVWNRAHFTKCFRCGAELTDAAKPENALVEPEFIDEEPVTYAAPKVLPEVQPQPEVEPEEELEVYSLYDNGDWDDEDEEDESVFGVNTVPAASVQPAEPVAEEVAAPAIYDEEFEEDDEPVTVYQSPAAQPAPVFDEMPVQEETRKFAPVLPDANDGATRKFDLATDASLPLTAQPAPAPVEPEVAPVEPGISHEIIHAIFTNPPTGIQADTLPEPMDEPRPRKLMSCTRRPVKEEDDEPVTVHKKYSSDKPEPRVDNVEEFKPTARASAMIADEKGDEYTAFATAERKLVADVTEHDPFDAAFDIPKPASAEEPAEEVEDTASPTEEEQPEITAPAVEAPAQEPEIAPVIVEPVHQPEPEQPEWVKEALFNLGSPNVESLSTARPHTVRTLNNFQLDATEEEPATRYERPAKSEKPAPEFRTLERTAPRAQRTQAAPVTPVAPRTARHAEQTAYNAPVNPIPQRPRTQRTEAPADQAFTSPRARAAAPVQQQRPVRPAAPQAPTARPYREPEMPARPQPRPRPQQPASAPVQRSNSAAEKKQAPTFNPLLLIPIGIAALLILALLLWGGISLIKGAVGIVKDKIGIQTEQNVDQLPEEDANAPTVIAGTVNGRPGHIITFKGNNNDIIYISNENLANSYNSPIVGGVGTLELEDSILIGNRFVTEDVEVTLNPVLHEAGSGKETPLAPVTFTVTPPDAYLEIVSPAGGADETTLGTYQVKVRVELGSQVTIAGNVVSDMIATEDNGLGSIVYNVSVEPTGDNNIPIVVQKEGCKSITEYIVLTRPVMTVPIELDAATPSSASSDSIKISGKVEAGVRVKVTSPISGDLHVSGDGSFNFTAKLENFGENDVIIKAEKDGEESILVHTVTYNPSFNDYVAKAWAMDYEALSSYAGDYKPFKCSGEVVEVLAQEPYTCIFNVGSDSNPKHIYLEMVPGKPLSTDMEYHVYADTHADGTKDGYPYMIGRFFIEAN